MYFACIRFVEIIAIMSYKNIEKAFKRGYKLVDDITTTTQAMGYYHAIACIELNEKKKEVEQVIESLAQEKKKYGQEHDRHAEVLAKYKKQKLDWKRLNNNYKNSRIECKTVHHWQMLVAARRHLTYKTLMRWRTSVFRIVIGKHETMFRQDVVTD
jgi:hypothetical protein